MRVEQYWSHSFIPDLIRNNGVAIDIGMHSGGFAKVVAPRCRKVIGFEPDPSWRGRSDLPANVQIVEKAIAATSGTFRFHVNVEKCSSLHYADLHAETIEVNSVTLEQALELVPDELVDLIKMDIEGEEIAVLSQTPGQLFNRVVQMTVEFHDFMDPSTRPQIRAIVDRMKGLGFYAFRFSWHNWGDILFINRNLVGMNVFQRWWILLRYKYFRGLLRIVKRRLAHQNN